MNWRLHGSMGCLEISMQTLVIHKLVCFTVDCNSFVWFISIWPSDPIFFFVLRREHARILLERKEKKIWVIHSNITFSLRTGWDTDQFMTDIAEATLVMSSVVKNVSGMNLLLMISCLSITCLGFFFYIQGNAVIFMSLINWLHLILLTGWTCTWWIQLWCQIVSAHWYFFCSANWYLVQVKLMVILLWWQEEGKYWCWGHIYCSYLRNGHPGSWPPQRRQANWGNCKRYGPATIFICTFLDGKIGPIPSK
jgi:hypothetical protein